MSPAAEGPTVTLLLSCPDRRGIVARTAGFVADHGGNVVHADQHIDVATGLFLMRLEWQLEGFALPRDELAAGLTPLATELGATWRLAFSDVTHRTAILVSRQDHCLEDLLLRRRAGEVRTDIAFVAGNHDGLRGVAERAGIPFHHLPVSEDGGHERRLLELVREQSVDLVVLAKHMRILAPATVAALPPTINIHHSFLPAFVGAAPYQQAFERGVKLIGATAHYVTAELDAGPIIEQDTVRVTHRDAVDDLVRKGRDLERVVLARAVRLHVENRVLVHGNRTSVFD